ncbi:hypothetical protein E6C76_16220 [Pseudothauera nasutitermitis]|uniref:Uncharacterized protein n=1 Tax=Pseudothauera nasutitermitis TaxID=2565930 RepID=A0A4S4ATK6_9RHOO|nr:hypothetical protein [Pseudothauera nasutitermitis]THF62816.1 hypothetical protein E6C76_16220 [Pseudothauera nasutitermitis]
MKIKRGISISLTLACFFMVSGCYHGYWKESKDRLIGTKFDPNEIRNETGDVYRAFVPKGEAIYYRVDQEPPNTRYFIKWTSHCRYSLLVDPNGTILSWRFEDTESPSRSCTIS